MPCRGLEQWPFRANRKGPAVPVSLPVAIPEVVQRELGVKGGATKRLPPHVGAEEHVAPVSQADGVGQVTERQRIAIASLEVSIASSKHHSLPRRDRKPA